MSSSTSFQECHFQVQTIECVESVNKDVLEEIVIIANRGKTYEERRKSNVLRNQINTLKELYKNADTRVVKYKTNDNNPYGRMFSTTVSIQNLPSYIRRHLCSGIHHDIDICSSAQSIIKGILVRHGIKVPPLLDLYVEDKNKVFKDVRFEHSKVKKYACDDTLKELFYISSFNNGNVATSPSIAILDAWSFQMRNLTNKLILKTRNIYKDVVSLEPNTKNYNGKWLARVVFYYERWIMHVMVEHFKSEGFEIAASIHDGIHLKKRKRPLADVDILACEATIARKTGFNIKLKEKTLTPSEKDYFKLNELIASN